MKTWKTLILFLTSEGKVWYLDDVKLLIKNSDEKLLAAKTLFENGFYGDAVSRAYYAMFFVTVEKSPIFRAFEIYNFDAPNTKPSKSLISGRQNQRF